jgi:hypothetical protein
MTTLDKYQISSFNGQCGRSVIIPMNAYSHHEFYNALGKRITNMPDKILCGKKTTLLNRSSKM